MVSLSSTERYRDTHLLWRTDTCITGGGHQIKDYHVFEYSDWVNAIVLTERLKSSWFVSSGKVQKASCSNSRVAR